MRSLADFEFNKAPLCEGMILACEAIRRDFPSQDVYDELERLVSLAKEEITHQLPLAEQKEKLNPQLNPGRMVKGKYQPVGGTVL